MGRPKKVEKEKEVKVKSPKEGEIRDETYFEKLEKEKSNK